MNLRRERRMVCVEYPGLVRDVSKMLQTLGGEEGVSRVSLRDHRGATELWYHGRRGGVSVVSLTTEI